MERERIDFGRRLREEREARNLTLAEVARVTKIPERSLGWLEAGKFEDLPGEVFVRGFLRSYARCVGVDGEGLVRAYGGLVSDRAEPLPIETEEPETPTEQLGRIAKALRDAGRQTRRVPLTLAVIILVIVATLTLSLLLRRPSHGEGGISARESAGLLLG